MPVTSQLWTEKDGLYVANKVILKIFFGSEAKSGDGSTFVNTYVGSSLSSKRAAGPNTFVWIFALVHRPL